jgi:hypothetical protein
MDLFLKLLFRSNLNLIGGAQVGSSFITMKYTQHIISVLFSTFIFLNGLSPIAYSDHSARDLLITFAEDSQLQIIGKTNLGKFSCHCNQWGQVKHNEFVGSVRDNKIYFDHASLEIPVEALGCQNRMMTSELHELLCNESDEGNIKVTFQEAQWYLNSLWSEKMKVNEPIGYFHVLLTIGGITKDSNVEIFSSNEQSDNKTLSTRGKIELQLSEFNIEPPTKMMGLVKVNNSLDTRPGSSLYLV